MAELTAQDASLLDKFKMQAREFAEAFRTLLASEDYVQDKPELKAQYDDLHDSGSVIKATVDKLTQTVDWIIAQFKDTFGLDGYSRGLGGLGVLPLIPIAAITAALAYMSGWVAKVYMFNQRVQEAKRLESRGVDPREASALASGVGADDNKSIGDAIGDIAKPAGILFAGWLLWKLIESNKGRN